MRSSSDSAAAVGVVDAADFLVEFVGEGGELRCEPLTRCAAVRFEDVAPARSFAMFKGQRNFPGRWWSSTVAAHVGYESWLERDHVMLLDFDPAVVGIASQPFWLCWPAGDGVRRHLPDYFVRVEDGTGLVIDVRPDERIKARDAEAFAVTAAACSAVGWRFRRVGVVESVFAANVRWLSRYRHPRCGRREDVVARLVEVFAQPTPLFAGAERAGDRLLVLPVLFHLLWQQVLSADLTGALLGSATVVHVSRPSW
ncbi:TnsA-like heteromeric transposase endonuclease subunit [Micromonospora sp. WMMD718]|uniref:TnsA-like heteromeric transposase endonuclease subunit n=1 Tax=Micromonospora sp. WMMD718 TaxID=3016098 RepID=UPI002417DD02|nr:TnsA-like heteromeric transposase endonuclease subunit [Micromonospora sp. WMMD718]MDG4750410.1 TnsA-like heteromeric transposase endonuclease subunit [Micromonospora sp. WMMD718]